MVGGQARSGRPSGRRAEIRRLLGEAGEPLGIAELAERLGVHPNTVRFHTDQLLEQGQIERVPPPRGVPGRPPQLFQAIRRMDPEGPRRYQLLAGVLADSLAQDPDARRRAVAAGRAWWRQHAPGFEERHPAGPTEPVERLLVLLDELGFAPEDPAEEHSYDDSAPRTELGLRHCPFLDLTVEDSALRSEVICPIHLGLMQGALEAWDASVTIDRLDPLVEPDRCVAHLAGAAS